MYNNVVTWKLLYVHTYLHTNVLYEPLVRVLSFLSMRTCAYRKSDWTYMSLILAWTIARRRRRREKNEEFCIPTRNLAFGEFFSVRRRFRSTTILIFQSGHSYSSTIIVIRHRFSTKACRIRWPGTHLNFGIIPVSWPLKTFPSRVFRSPGIIIFFFLHSCYLYRVLLAPSNNRYAFELLSDQLTISLLRSFFQWLFPLSTTLPL